VAVRIWLLRHFNLGWYKRTRNYDEAKAMVKGIRLLNRREIQALFPGDSFYVEKFAFLAKSLIIIKK